MPQRAGEPEAFSCIHCQDVTSEPNFRLHVKQSWEFILFHTVCTAPEGLLWLVNNFLWFWLSVLTDSMIVCFLLVPTVIATQHTDVAQ